jgi:5-methylcytosine-specific restriction endonuclease McrA
VKCGKAPEKVKYLVHFRGTEKGFREYYSKLEQSFLRFGYVQYNGKNELVAYLKDRSQLVADHIVPIALGGDEWDINNIQTLCLECNKEKTAQDIKEIAKARKKEKLEAEGQKFLA